MAELSVLRGLYPEGLPRNLRDDDTAEDSPTIRAVTGGRKKRKGAPRDLSTRIDRRAAPKISAPRRGFVERAYEGLDRLSPQGGGLGRLVREPLEAVLGPAEMENAVTRALRELTVGGAYDEAPEMRQDDAMLLGLTGAAGPAFKMIGSAGRAALRALPEATRTGGAALGKYLTDVAPMQDISRPVYEKAVEGPFTIIQRKGLEPQTVPEAASETSLAALRRLAQDRTRSPAIRAAACVVLGQAGRDGPRIPGSGQRLSRVQAGGIRALRRGDARGGRTRQGPEPR